jgi:hypothetical protein
MNPADFVDKRRKRCLGQTLGEFERHIQRPLQQLAQREEPISAYHLQRVLNDMELVKDTIRKQIQALASDCLDLMPPELEINAFEPVRR